MRLNDKIANNADYINILHLFSDYDYNEIKENFKFKYILEDQNLSGIREKYEYKYCVVKDNEFRTLVQLMVWVFDHLLGDGMCIPPSQFNADTVLSLTKSQKLHSNCYMYATVLNEIYLSMGFFSRMVRCMPMDISFNDCHCVTEVYCNEFGKWIILDAANRAYYVNKMMLPLNLFELREAVRQGQSVMVPMMKRSESSRLMEYWSKNLVRFESDRISRYGNESSCGNRTILHFQSKNFPISDKVVFFSDNNLKIKHIHTSNPHLFWNEPEK